MPRPDPQMEFFVLNCACISCPSEPARADRWTFALRRAFTLVEMLVAMVVTLIMLGIVVTIFGLVGDNISKSNSAMEMNDQIRTAKQLLQLDLAGYTVQMLPPRNPDNGEGYFEIIEGPVGRVPANTQWKPNQNSLPDPNSSGTLTPDLPGPDSTVGDTDDILMLTTRSQTDQFQGRFLTSTTQSKVAEVAWFLRGTTLYRRQLLVRPDVTVPQPTSTSTLPYYVAPDGSPSNFYAMCDLSVRATGQIPNGQGFDLSPSPAAYKVVANSLSDLTKRENRFAHRPTIGPYTGTPGVAAASPYGFPHDARGWGVFYSTRPYGSATLAGIATWGRLGLPTLRECSSPYFPLPGTLDLMVKHQLTLGEIDPSGTPVLSATNKQLEEPFDAWTNPFPAWYGPDPSSGNLVRITQSSDPNPINKIDDKSGTLSYYFPDGPNSRLGEDIVLSNVLSFDIRVWDPGAPWFSDGNGNLAMPEDPNYAAAVVHFLDPSLNVYPMNPTPQPSRLVGCGAYVDLYYSANVINFVRTSPNIPSGQRLATETLVQNLFQNQLNTPTSPFLNTPSPFSGPGMLNSKLGSYDSSNNPSPYIPSVYDTGSSHYEDDGINQDGNRFSTLDSSNNLVPVVDQGTNGLDDPFFDSTNPINTNAMMPPLNPLTNGLVDETGDGITSSGEREAPPPYAAPLRGVQIKIRCFEPDSMQIREVTVIQEFVPE